LRLKYSTGIATKLKVNTAGTEVTGGTPDQARLARSPLVCLQSTPLVNYW